MRLALRLLRMVHRMVLQVLLSLLLEGMAGMSQVKSAGWVLL
jgi:hypothetical protein